MQDHDVYPVVLWIDGGAVFYERMGVVRIIEYIASHHARKVQIRHHMNGETRNLALEFSDELRYPENGQRHVLVEQIVAGLAEIGISAPALSERRNEKAP